MEGLKPVKAWWVYQFWQDFHWEPSCNKQRELSFGKGHTWRASSQWRLDGYPSLGETSTGNPYAWIISSDFAIKGKDSTGSPESCLACLLAHNVSSCSSWPLHLVSLLFYDSNICKERQKWYNWCSIMELFSRWTHHGLMILYGIRDLGQHWSR